MRAFLFIPFVAACVSTDIATGSYLCGPDASCPEGQACNGPNNVCVLPGLAEPFACEELPTEPDDTAAMAYSIDTPDCVGLAAVINSCMLDGDTADWVKFSTPAACTGVGVEARVSFPVAFERLGIDLYDLDTNQLLTSDIECVTGSGESGEELRCLQANLAPGKNYGVQVRPAGDGDCGGTCAHNRYTLRVQLAAPR